MTHFTDRELQQWGSMGLGEDRARVITHVGACASCAARYAEAIRAVPVAADPAPPDEARAFAAVAYDIPARRSAVVAFPAKRRWLVGLAAAAAVVAAVAIPYVATHRPPGSAPDVNFRGGGIHALEPIGAVDRAASFGWYSDVRASRYRLDIGDATGVVLTRDTDRSFIQLSPESSQTLRPGVDYWWSVTALDRDGRTLASSQRQAFTVRAR